MKPALASIVRAARHVPCGRETAVRAVERGDITRADMDRSGFIAAQVEEALFPADMAVEVALKLLTSPLPVDAPGWCLYSHIHYQGQPPLWSPASYILSAIGAQQTMGLNIRQGCNAAMLSLEIACSLLAAGQAQSALCLAADRFNISGFNRWSADYGIAYGDGAAGILIGDGACGGAVADILAIRSTNAPSLERLHRHAAPLEEGVFVPHDIRSTKKQFLAEYGAGPLTSATQAALTLLWTQIQEDTGVRPADIRHLVLPHLGQTLLRENYCPVFDLPNAQNNIAEGLHVGHLGCADAFHGLCSVLESRPAPGSIALLVGAGAGFSWSLCLVRFR